jgi:hypothetical protein
MPTSTIVPKGCHRLKLSSVQPNAAEFATNVDSKSEQFSFVVVATVSRVFAWTSASPIGILQTDAGIGRALPQISIHC